MNALVSGIALLLAYVSFIAYDLVTSRQAAVNNLTGEAQIIGTNSAAAIIFNDKASAQTTLSALSNSSDVIAAAIYTQQVNSSPNILQMAAHLSNRRPCRQARCDPVLGAELMYSSAPELSSRGNLPGWCTSRRT
jgi:hypothetical protein